MESLGFDEAFNERCESHDFGRQVVSECSRSFHKSAGVKLPRLSEFVVEVAHQPLFYPNEHFFKKFEVGWEVARERKGTLVWGVVDDDFFLFPRMWRSERRKLMSNREANPRRVAFWAVPKPVELTEFPKAKGLAEHNAFVIARELNERGIYPVCFQYSVLPFLGKQFFWFQENAKAFRWAFNDCLVGLKLKGCAGVAGMRELAEGELPLWSVNDDGSKETLCVGDFVKRIGFKAVARDLAFADFLQTRVYVSGKGAACGYGLITRRVREKLGLPVVETIVV